MLASFKFTNVMLPAATAARACCESMLALIMFTIEPVEELYASGVTVNALHPATYMDTTASKRRRGDRHCADSQAMAQRQFVLAFRQLLYGQGSTWRSRICLSRKPTAEFTDSAAPARSPAPHRRRSVLGSDGTHWCPAW